MSRTAAAAKPCSVRRWSAFDQERYCASGERSSTGCSRRSSPRGSPRRIRCGHAGRMAVLRAMWRRTSPGSDAASSLASLIGDDAAGAELKAGVEAAGIHCQYLRSVPGARTAEYTAIFHGGELFAAFADMAIFDDWPSGIDGRTRAGNERRSWVFADCNLPPARPCPAPSNCASLTPSALAVDAVSVAKSARLGEDLSQLDLLFLNRDEARAMTGMREAGQAMRHLKERGAARVVMTDGAAGAHALADGSPLWFAGAGGRNGERLGRRRCADRRYSAQARRETPRSLPRLEFGVGLRRARAIISRRSRIRAVTREGRTIDLAGDGAQHSGDARE